MEIEDWDDLRYILAAARSGTLTETARSLGVDQTTVSRRLKAAQDRAGLLLFERLRGGIILTAAGEAIVEAGAAMEQALNERLRRAQGEDLALTGTLRLTLPELLGHVWMKDLCAFAHAHQRIDFEIKASDSLKSLTRRDADVALRVIDQPDEHLVGRRIAPMAIGVYASPAWSGTPVEQVPWVGWEPKGFEVTTIERTRQRVGGRGSYTFWADSYMLILDAMREGMGASVVPVILGDRDDDLVRLGEPLASPQWLWILTHEDLRRSARVRALMDHLGEFIAAEREALLGGLVLSGV